MAPAESSVAALPASGTLSSQPKSRSTAEPARQTRRRWFRRLMTARRLLSFLPTSFVIAGIGGYYTYLTGRQHDYQTAVQILNQREQSELQARREVFDKPLATLLNKQNNSIESRVLTLETFLYNFHGIINARNLLTDLEAELEELYNRKPETRLAKTRSKNLQAKLLGIAKGISSAQKQMIMAAMREPITVDCDHHHIVRLHKKEAPNEWGTATCTIRYARRWWWDDEHKISITPLCVGKHAELQSHCPRAGSSPSARPVFVTSARICMRDPGQCKTQEPRKDNGFELTQFGTPFSDNSILDHGHRVALLLRSVSDSDLELEVLAFPEDLVPPGYRPTIPNTSRLLGGESG